MKLWIFIIFYVTSEAAIAASFVCDKNSNSVESIICSDSALSGLDVELSQVYEKVINAASPEGKAFIKREQINWIKSRNKCGSAECLNYSYKSRLEELGNYTQETKFITEALGGENHTVVVYYDTNKRNASFDKSGALKAGGKITQCTDLVDVPIGTRSGNHSFGGYCFFLRDDGVQVKVQVCDDDMAGHFKMQPSVGGSDIKALASFVFSNCYGG